jgi:hypothetical protein
MKTRFTTAFQATAFILATLAATSLLVAAGLAEDEQPDGTRIFASGTPHVSARTAP